MTFEEVRNLLVLAADGDDPAYDQLLDAVQEDTCFLEPIFEVVVGHLDELKRSWEGGSK